MSPDFAGMNDPSNDPTSDPDRLGELSHESTGRLHRGERPTPADRADRHPEMADRIRELFPTLLEMEPSGSGLGPETSPFAPGEDRYATVPRVLGEYRVVREIGRGGMGVVYEAVQESLGRHVAVKVLPDRGRLAPNQLERFIREAKAAALLHHTNIVPVFGVGVHEGVHYYAMQYIEGQGLDAVLAEVRRLRLRRNAPEPPVCDTGTTASLATGVAQGFLTGRFLGPGSSPDPAPTVAATASTTDGPVGPPPRPGAGPGRRVDATSTILGATEAYYHRSVARLARRWPRRWRTPMPTASCTATSSRPTS